VKEKITIIWSSGQGFSNHLCGFGAEVLFFMALVVKDVMDKD